MKKLLVAAGLAATFPLQSALALDLGNGFSLTGSVELEYIHSPSVEESLSFTDLTLGWRSQAGSALGFGADVTFRDDRFLSDGESENMIWAALVMTTGFGELAVGRPVPVLSAMFDVPQVGGARFVDRFILEAGGSDGSFLRELSFFTDLSSKGMTFRGNRNGLGYGIGVHRYTAGPQTVDGYEIALSYQTGGTELFAGFETLDLPGTAIDRLRAGARYTADRWSVGAHVAEFEGPTLDATVSTLFADYRISEAFKIGAQVLDVSVTGGSGLTFYGMTGDYAFGTGGFAQIGLLGQKDGSEEAVTASIGYRF